MIDFELTEEQKQIKALIKEFCEREVDVKYLQELSEKAGRARTVEELRGLYPHELMKKCHEVGLRQLCVPEKYGGGGFGKYHSVTRTIACEDLGYYMGLGSRLLTVPYMTQAEMSHDDFTDEERDWFFTRYMSNSSFTCAVSGTEPTSTADASLPYEEIGTGYPVKTIAYKDGDEWVINGDKMHSSSGGIADVIRVTTRTDKTGPVATSRTAFWVLKDTPGMSYTVNRLLMGEIGGNVQIIYDNVRVPDSQRVGPVNGAKGNAFGGAKTMVFMDWLGHCQRIYEQVVTFAKERMGGGVPIIQHTSIAAMLGEVALHLDATRAFAYRVCWENDQRERAKMPLLSWDSNGVNYWVRKTSGLLCDVGFEVYAGMGGDLDLEFEGLVRRSFTWPQGNRTMSAIKYSKVKNDHILAQQRAQLEKAAAIGVGY